MILVGAVLLRETLVLVAAGLVLSRHLRLGWALVPPAALVAWLGVLYLRVGALPGGQSRFAVGGLLDAAESWGAGDWAVVVPIVALIAVAALRSPLGMALVLPHLALIVVMGEPTGVIP